MQKPLARPGGKNTLVRRLLTLIPEHRIYVEPFAGTATLLFAKERSYWELLNDTDGEILNFFRVSKHRPAELAELFEQECVHAGRFAELRDNPPPHDECQRALRFAYLVWFSFGSRQQHFLSLTARSAATYVMPTRRALFEVRALLKNVAHRLNRVLLEQRDFADCITRYDSAETFYYLDPPYVGTKGQDTSYPSLSMERHAELAAILSSVKGKWLLSYGDHPEVRRLYRRFKIQAVSCATSISPGGKGRPARRELLIRNF
jgi:DNA adenine methylase